MKIHGMHRMLGVLLSAVIVISSIIFPPLARAAQVHYSDDAIVRDLKGGKLTVREAQMLQARRNPAAARPVNVHKNIKISRPLHAKPGKAEARRHKTVARQQRSRAPIRHLTRPHLKHGAKAHATPVAASDHNAVSRKTARARLMSANMTGNGSNVTVREHHRAIKNIR